jgi:hypothetical protein
MWTRSEAPVACTACRCALCGAVSSPVPRPWLLASFLGNTFNPKYLADTAQADGGSVLVATASPGLFTLSQDGKGQAAALNQDGTTANGPSSPAPKGSVISLFGPARDK